MKYFRLLILFFALSLLTSGTFAAGSSPEANSLAHREVGQLVLENVPDIPEALGERMSQYQNVRSASLSGWLPGGKGILISTRFAETSQIHRVDKPGGTRSQLTFFNEPVRGAHVSSDPSVNGFLYLRDVGGSEYYQLFFFDFGTGKSVMISDGTSRNGDVLWAPGSTRFAYRSTRRNGKDYDVIVTDIRDPEKELFVLECEGSWGPESWSPDGKKLMLWRYLSSTESEFHIWDLESEEVEFFPSITPEGAYGFADWGSDKDIYYTMDYGDEFKNIFLENADSSTYEKLSQKMKGCSVELSESDIVYLMNPLTKSIPWDVTFLTVSPNQSALAFLVNEGGVGRLHLKKLPSWKPVKIPDIPMGQISGLKFSPDGKHLGFTLYTPSGPGDVYSFEIGRTKLTRWTFSEIGGLDTSAFITPELFEYPTFDKVGKKTRRDIPAFIYKPKGEGPFPVVIYIHGGPESQYTPYFSTTFQYYLNEMGIAVVAPNVRGSRGYGKSYIKLDNGFLREDSVKDIGALLDWIEKQSDLDQDRVAVMGGSYGGYMSLAAMTHYNERLRCGIDTVGISNFVTFLTNTKPYRRDLRRVEYGDERDPKMHEFLEKISPTNNAQKITKPMYIVQGLNDPRVPAGEAEQMVKIIRKNGGEVWYMLAKDEGHGMSKKSNRDFYKQSVVLFLKKHLLGE